jgi:hypothetical protein
LVVKTKSPPPPWPSFEKRLLTSKKTLDVKLEHNGGLASGVDLSGIPLSTLLIVLFSGSLVLRKAQ